MTRGVILLLVLSLIFFVGSHAETTKDGTTFDTLVQKERQNAGRAWNMNVIRECANILYRDIIRVCARRSLVSSYIIYRYTHELLNYPQFKQYQDEYSYNIIAREIARMSDGRIKCTVVEWFYNPSIECSLT